MMGGLVCVPMYGYNWVMTLAQLELIGNDKPLSLLKRGRGKVGKVKAPSAKSIEKALERYAEKGKGDRAFNPGEYMNME